ncbi:MAG: cupin domain-containing protein [Rhodanobacteraceae bacterium]|nr:MAG: cupin domain-containing protein [Rhodanobacteraceae bacterium]
MTPDTPASPVINLADLDVRPARAERAPAGDHADQYDTRWAAIASRIGARKLGYNLTVVAPGKRNCPFHSHRAEEEMFFILEGTGELRYGDKRYPLRRGDIIACPSGGPETAHQIINTGASEMRYLALSTLAPIEVCEYPDSGKFGVYEDQPWDEDVRREPMRHLARREDTRDYWEGE